MIFPSFKLFLVPIADVNTLTHADDICTFSEIFKKLYDVYLKKFIYCLSS